MNDGVDENISMSRTADGIAAPEMQANPQSDSAALAETGSRELANARIIAASGFFDAEWYVTKYPEALKSGLDPALHYIRHGGAKSWSPGPAFDAADYLAKHKDVRQTGMNPLLHYIAFGKLEARKVRPADADEVNARLIQRSNLFDAGWYVANYPEAAKSSLPPHRYFLKHGREKGHHPSLDFDSAAYISAYADVGSSKINPLLHYLQFGRAEGRAIGTVTMHPVAAEEPVVDGRHEANAKLIGDSGFFDAEWYVAKYPETTKSGLAPALHYLKIGGAKGYAPGPGFDGADYLAQNKDVRLTGMNPLVHYVSFGRSEARPVKPADAEEVNARLIMRSGLFDAAWYRSAYPEVAKSRLTPLRYFLKHGREKGHSPGPLFDAGQYIASYGDVETSKINPLLHYLQFGRGEGRAISGVSAKAVDEQSKDPKQFAADLALIEQSPLFDRTWYFNRYPEIARLGIAAAEHYLRFGATELRQPSIYFDPQYYVIEQSPEIQQTGINPLVHFLKVGRALGRKPRALFEFAPAPDEFKASGLMEWPVPAVDGGTIVDTMVWTRHAQLQQKPGPFSLRIGSTVVASADDENVFLAAQDRVAVFTAMMGLDHGRDVSGLAGAAFRPASYNGLGPELAQGPSRIIDAWFAAGRTLRIRAGDETQDKRRRLAIRAFQYVVTDKPEIKLCGEALLGERGPDFFDLNLVSALLPVFIVLSTPDGQAVEIGLLPFPSLCRGGLHYSELLGTAHVSNPLLELRTLSDGMVRDFVKPEGDGQQRLVSDIVVQLNGAIGTEPIFSSAILSWISGVFGVAVAADGDGAADTPGESHLRGTVQTVAARRRDGQFSLMLPPDAVPTIAALTAPALAAVSGCSRCTGPYFVADAVTARPRLSVVLPPLGADLMDLRTPDTPLAYPVLLPKGPSRTPLQEQQPVTTAAHLAIRFTTGPETHRAVMLMPHAPDHHQRLFGSGTGNKERVGAAIQASDPFHLDTFISSLLKQRGIDVCEVVAVARAGQAETGPLQAVLDRLLPGRGRIVTSQEYRPAYSGPLCELQDSEFTIHAEDTMVLHDVRTVETLLAVLRTERTATAGCVILRETALRKGSLLNFESGGYFPSHVSLLSAPRLILTLPDCRDALAGMTYPVIANDPSFMVVRNDVAQSLAGNDGESEGGIAFSLKAIAAGYRHLCTSVVRATSLHGESRSEVADPPGIQHLGTHQWEAVLSSVTLLRGLN